MKTTTALTEIRRATAARDKAEDAYIAAINANGIGSPDTAPARDAYLDAEQRLERARSKADAHGIDWMGNDRDLMAADH